ncbi:MAG: transporter substrate-binding domain-containing protein [Rickettsiaceae bacterium]|nr:transporter substrate-binding domain-containing protein [Rickettsiaceae bacterium]
MRIFRIFLFVFTIGLITTSIFAHKKQNHCDILTVKNQLSGLWYPYKPYQYNSFTFDHKSLKGLDVDLFDLIRKNIDLHVEYVETKDFDILEKLKLEKKDFTAGITFSNERGKDFYFSKPYRYEVYDVYTLKDSKVPKLFDNIGEFLVTIVLANHRLGVVKNYNYGNDRVNNFISKHDGCIVQRYATDGLAFEAFLREEVDYLIVENYVASSLFIEYNFVNKVFNLGLKTKVPVHFVFNKDTVPVKTVYNFNQAIDKIINNYEYIEVLNSYLQPYLFFEVLKSDLFNSISLISALLFAVSGSIFAAKAGMSFFGCCVVVLLPSLVSNYCTELMVNFGYVTNSKNYTISYLYLVLVVLVAAVLFFMIKSTLNKDTKDNVWKELIKFADILDLLARCHIVLLTSAYIFLRAVQPVILFAPIVSLVPISLGIVIRDIIIDNNRSSLLYNSSAYVVNALLSSVFVLIFGLYDIQSIFTHTNSFIVIAVILTILVQFAVRYLTIFRTG